LSDDSSVQN